MKHLFLLISLLGGLTCSIYAQLVPTDTSKTPPKGSLPGINTPYTPNNLPPSPNAASLGKYGEIPVSYYTGLPNTSIPIYTIEDGDLKVPVSLNYHHSGIKVEEEASNIGLGWALNAGGVITRTIRGLDDLSSKGIPFHPIPADPEHDTYFKNNLADGQWGFPGVDTEPDIFYYNVGGQSGKFILAAATQFPLKGISLSKTDIDITCNLLPSSTSANTGYQWVIILADGTQYFFEEQEISATLSAFSTAGNYDTPQYYESHPELYPIFDLNSSRNGHRISAWYLSNIYSINSLKNVSFIYDHDVPFYATSRMNVNETYQFSTLEGDVTGCVTPSTLQHKSPGFGYSVSVTRNTYLKSINFGNGQIDFTYSDRQDIQQYFPNGNSTLAFPGSITQGNIEDRTYNQVAKKPQKLDRIAIRNALGTLIKQVDFTYSYFNYSWLATSSSPTQADFMNQFNNLRLRLDKVTEKDNMGNNQNPPYQFRYVGDTYDANGNLISTTTLPSKTSWAKDYYGYYNGKVMNNTINNQHIIPKLAYPKLIGEKTFSGAYTLTRIGFSNTFAIGIDREVDTTMSNIASMNLIAYPTGGYTSFGYGFHKTMGGAGEVESGEMVATASNTPAALVIGTNDATTYFADLEFQLKCTTYGSTTGCLPTIPSTIASTWYAKIQSFGNVVKNRTYSDWANKQCIVTPSVSTCIYTNSETQVALPTGVHQLSINPQVFVGYTLPLATAKMTYYRYHTNDYKEMVVGGLRIDKITDYTADGMSKIRLFSYTNDDGSSTAKQLRPATKFVAGYLEALRVQDQTNPWQSGCTRKNWGVEMNAYSLSPLGSSASGNVVGYSKVKVTEVNTTNNQTNGYALYEYHNEPDSLPTSMVFADIPARADLANGMLTREGQYNNKGNIKHEVRYQNTLKPTQSFLYDGMQFLYGYDNNQNLVLTKGKYKIPAQFWYVSQKTERLYNGTAYVETSNTFNYGSTKHNLMTSQSSIDSKLNMFQTTMGHPNEMIDNGLDPTGVYATMLSKHIIEPVIETIFLYNTLQTSRKLINYVSWNNNSFFAPSSIQTQMQRVDPLVTQIVFTNYDARTNLLSYTLQNGHKASFTYFSPTDLGKTDLVKSYTLAGGTAGTTLARTINYEYIPLVGLSSTTDINGYTTTYNYDNFNRLASIKDTQGYLLAENFYHYANQNALSGLGISPNNASNYVVTRSAREAQTGTALDSDVTKTSTQIQYLDGLGRPLQTQLWKASPDQTKDLITTTSLYDAFGRDYKHLLPTPSNTNTAAFNNTAESLAQVFYGDDAPSTETVFEASPLNRPFKQFGAGQAWRTANKFTQLDYSIAGNEVLRFDIQASGFVTGNARYPSNSLFKNLIANERGIATTEIKDKQGRVLSKWQQLDANTSNVAMTDYVYNDLGQLTYVIPPKIDSLFQTGAISFFAESDNVFLEGIYGYHYDDKGRLIEKHIPGAGWTRYVYDKNDRIVLENDDKDAAANPNYYKFTQYDALGRAVRTGLITGIGATNRTTIQTAFDNQSDIQYSPWGAFPSAYQPMDANVKSVTYYDDYAWQTETAYNFQNANAFHNQGVTKGMVTGALVRNLETNDWYKSVSYYDYKGRVIQSFSQNHLGGIDRTDFQYRFNNEVLKTRVVHTNNLQSITEIYEYTYDHVGRKTSFVHIKDGVSQKIAKYNYDAIGRMTQKVFKPAGSSIGSKQSGQWTDVNTWLTNSLPTISDLVTINNNHSITIPSNATAAAGSLIMGTNANLILQSIGQLNMGSASTSNLQTLDYKYHIRGGLLGINLDANNNLTNSLFSYKLTYEEDGTYYDGNIRKQSWKSNLDNKERSFTYTYDGASRIKSAVYTSQVVGENYALNSVNYDRNGNILALSRNGLKSTNTFGLIDNLAYTYNANSNKILKVDDLSNETASFKDVAGTSDYTYYPDGFLKSDANKGITLIEYNYLKLPRKIVQNGVEILNQYDARGKKLKETIGSQVTDYVGNKIYKNNTLYQITHDEGRIVDGLYEYFINDHLGSLRVAFRDSSGIAKISQKQDFDPFGAELQKISYLKSAWKQSDFKYSGKEFIEETGLNDYGWRQQDPILGRMWGIDNRAEKYYSQSPMQFALNNPLLVREVDGDTVTVAASSEAQKGLLQVINQGLGGFYTGSINSNGQLTLSQTNKKGEMTKSQSAFAEILNQITQGENITIGVTQNDTQVLVGSYDLETIDISDVQQFGSDKDGKPTSSSSVLSHELAEQYHKQTNRLGKNGYDESHEKGLEAEKNITGFRRDESSIKQTSGRDSFGNPQGSSQINYIKRDKIVPVTIYYNNLNVTKVKP